MINDYCPTCCDRGYYYTALVAMPYEPFDENDTGDFKNTSLQICHCQAGARFVRAKRLEKLLAGRTGESKKELCRIYKQKLKELKAIKQELES